MADEAKNNDEIEIPKAVRDAVTQSENIPEEEQETAARVITEKLEELGISGDDTKVNSVVPILVGAVAGAFAIMPKESHAFAGSFVNAILKDALAPLMSLLETLVGSAMSVYDQFITGGAQSTAGTITSSTDAINHVRTQIEEQRLQAATAPTPMQCESDAIGIQSILSDAHESAYTETGIFALTSGSMASDLNATADDFKLQVERHGDSGANLNVYSILRAEGIETDEQAAAAADFLKNTVNVDRRSPSNTNINQTLAQGYTREAYRLMAEKAKLTNRRQIAMKPLVRAKSANDNRQGPGSRKVMTEEVRRTYGSGSGQWREEIRGYADPTPLIAELNLLTAFSNHVLVKQLDTAIEGNMVDSVHLLELLDK